MVYFLAVFLFHSIATMPTIYWTKAACEDAGKQMGARYSCLELELGPTRPLRQTPFEYPIWEDTAGLVTADAPAHAAAEAQIDNVDWETRRQFMHRTFQNIRGGRR